MVNLVTGILPSGSAGTAATLSYRSLFTSTGNSTAYTFTSDISTAQADRFVLVGIIGSGLTNRSLVSITVNGSTATIATSLIATASFAATGAIAAVAQATGTIATTVVTFSAPYIDLYASVWSAYGLGTATPTATMIDTSAPLSGTISVSAGGVAIGISRGQTLGTAVFTATWPEFTERNDEFQNSAVETGADLTSASATSALSSVVFSSSAVTAWGLLAASWR